LRHHVCYLLKSQWLLLLCEEGLLAARGVALVVWGEGGELRLLEEVKVGWQLLGWILKKLLSKISVLHCFRFVVVNFNSGWCALPTIPVAGWYRLRNAPTIIFLDVLHPHNISPLQLIDRHQLIVCGLHPAHPRQIFG
jgi:hypothetical protein